MTDTTVALRVLVCDADDVTGNSLVFTLRQGSLAADAAWAGSLREAEAQVATGGFNTIFIDPLTLGLDEATEFIFRTRKTHPDVVFVLYLDIARAEADRERFYRGRRSRFSHYYTVDKQTPPEAFASEVDAVLENCRRYLLWKRSRQEVTELRSETQRLAADKPDVDFRELSNRIDRLLERLPADEVSQQPLSPFLTRRNTVFFSHRFAEEEYERGLTGLLRQRGFEVVTGDDTIGYVGKAIIQRISECEYFLCLMTRDQEKADGTYTTSPWLLEEKGVALAYGKYLVLLVEEGVTDFGALQGDWQRYHFEPKGFTEAALKAVDQLVSASGASQST